MTGQRDIRLCKLGGGYNGLLNECIRRYFFPSRAKEKAKKKKKPDLRLVLYTPGKHMD